MNIPVYQCAAQYKDNVRINSCCCFISVVCQTTFRYTDTPRFLDTGQGYNVTVHRGQKAELACKVENIGPKEVGVAVNKIKVVKTQS